MSVWMIKSNKFFHQYLEAKPEFFGQYTHIHITYLTLRSYNIDYMNVTNNQNTHYTYNFSNKNQDLYFCFP
jgi:hypothetical protein